MIDTARLDWLDTLGIITICAVILFGAFVFGTMVGDARAECGIVERNRDAFVNGGDYWGSSMRTVVESCDRGEGM